MPGVFVRTQRFDPIPNSDNDGKFVINMVYNCEDDGVINRTKTFTLKWEGLDSTGLLQELGLVLGWLEELGVHESAWDAAIDYTLLALEELLEEAVAMVHGSLGLEVSIRVCDTANIGSGGHDQEYESLEPVEYQDVGEDFEFEFEFELEEYQDGDVEGVKKALGASGVTFVEVRGDLCCGCCTICLEEFKEDVGVAVLNCSHVLHGDCLIPWVLKAGINNPATCPLCRSPLLLPNSIILHS